LRELGIGRVPEPRCDQVPDKPGAEMQHDTSPFQVKFGPTLVSRATAGHRPGRGDRAGNGGVCQAVRVSIRLSRNRALESQGRRREELLHRREQLSCGSSIRKPRRPERTGLRVVNGPALPPALEQESSDTRQSNCRLIFPPPISPTNGSPISTATSRSTATSTGSPAPNAIRSVCFNTAIGCRSTENESC
jgi:hypothetical protein